MSTNSPGDMKGVALYSENNAAEKQLDLIASPSKDNPPPATQAVTRAHSIQIWVALLLVICLGSLGSFSLAPYILPGLIQKHDTTGTRIKTTIMATPIASTPTLSKGSFTESECTATPQNTKYSPPSSETTGDQALPLEWLQAGRTQQDFANAQACAATFIMTYQSFNTKDPKTFESSVSMLTGGAKQRFYGSALNTRTDTHMDPMWRAALLKQQIQQTTQVSQPSLLKSHYTNKQLLVWMVVPCQITIQQAGNKPVTESNQFSVLLVSVPLNTQKTETGWQISQWQEGRTEFDPLYPL